MKWRLFFFISLTFFSIKLSAEQVCVQPSKECCLPIVDKILDPKKIGGFLFFESDLIFRGLTYTNHRPRVGGALKYTHDTGIYLGFFATSITQPGTSFLFIPNGGYAGKKGKFIWDLNFSYWTFVRHTAPFELDFFEVKGEVGYSLDKVVIKTGLAYSPDYYFESGVAWYPYANFRLQLPCKFFTDGEIGYQSTAKQTWMIPDYLTWNVSIGRDFTAFIAGARYTRTNLSRTRCGSLGAPPSTCKPTVVAYIIRPF